MIGSERFPGPSMDDISWNTQQSEITCRYYLQIGPVPSWVMGIPTHLKIFNPELFLSKGNAVTKNGAETEGTAIQRLLHLVIHSICRHQTQSLLLMERSAYWQEPGITVPWEALPEPDQYRCRYPQPTIGLSMVTSIEELGEGLKELKGIATP